MEPRNVEGSARRRPGVGPGRVDELDPRRVYSCACWRGAVDFAGALRARLLQLWQFIRSPDGIVGGYRESR